VSFDKIKTSDSPRFSWANRTEDVPPDCFIAAYGLGKRRKIKKARKKLSFFTILSFFRNRGLFIAIARDLSPVNPETKLPCTKKLYSLPIIEVKK
jgi:hypothetical protein